MACDGRKTTKGYTAHFDTVGCAVQVQILAEKFAGILWGLKEL
jgi:hypothetical protein